MLEFHDLHVAYPIFQYFRLFYAFYFHYSPFHLEIQDIPVFLVNDRYLDLRTRRPPQQFHRVVHRHLTRGLSLDLDDLIPGLYPGAERRRIFYRGDNRKNPVSNPYFDTYPSEFPFCLFSYLLKTLLVHELTVPVKSVHHPSYCPINKIFRFYWFDIIRTYQSYGIGEQLYLPKKFFTVINEIAVLGLDKESRRKGREDHKRYINYFYFSHLYSGIAILSRL